MHSCNRTVTATESINIDHDDDDDKTNLTRFPLQVAGHTGSVRWDPQHPKWIVKHCPAHEVLFYRAVTAATQLPNPNTDNDNTRLARNALSSFRSICMPTLAPGPRATTLIRTPTSLSVPSTTTPNTTLTNNAAATSTMPGRIVIENLALSEDESSNAAVRVADLKLGSILADHRANAAKRSRAHAAAARCSSASLAVRLCGFSRICPLSTTSNIKPHRISIHRDLGRTIQSYRDLVAAMLLFLVHNNDYNTNNMSNNTNNNNNNNDDDDDDDNDNEVDDDDNNDINSSKNILDWLLNDESISIDGNTLQTPIDECGCGFRVIDSESTEHQIVTHTALRTAARALLRIDNTLTDTNGLDTHSTRYTQAQHRWRHTRRVAGTAARMVEQDLARIVSMAPVALCGISLLIVVDDGAANLETTRFMPSVRVRLVDFAHSYVRGDVLRNVSSEERIAVSVPDTGDDTAGVCKGFHNVAKLLRSVQRLCTAAAARR